MRIILVIAFFLSATLLSAQINAGETNDNTFHLFEGGVYAGFNFSQVDGDNYAGFNKLGVNAGPVVHINFNPNWSMSLEILFSQKGSRTKPDPNNFNTYFLSLNYAEVPVMINYNDKNRLIFQAGASYGRLFNIKEEINGVTPTNYDGFYSDEFSYLVGGTLLIGEAKHFGVNVRYEHSITAIGKSANPKVPGLVNKLITVRGVYYF